MHQNRLLLPTLREVPADAEAASHRLLLRAGFIRPLASGVYAFLPLGWRVLRRIERIIRQEMDGAGAQELHLSAMQPAELWQRSGRYDEYGPELIRFHDRGGREFALGPTHEEVITTLAGQEIGSYRQLPLTVYQIQTKFRDERRPRFGLLRCREFLMKDAYSFDADREGLEASYTRMYEAYCRIFERCGLRYRAVLADAGSIGGDGGTHEFIALAEIGEDTIAVCTGCDYAANLEKAEAAPPAGVAAGRSSEAAYWQRALPEDSQAEAARHPSRTSETGFPEAVPLHAQAAGRESAVISAYERFHTPGVRTIEQLVQTFRLEARDIIKTLLYLADGEPIAVLIRGDQTANEIKLAHYLGASRLELADAETAQRITGAPVGFAGPIGLSVPLLVDVQVAAMEQGITGANAADYHYRGVRPGRDFALDRVGDFRNVGEGDACPRCRSALALHKGIEIGHVFKLGTKYSEVLEANFADASGQEHPLIMGCYGIGISRLLAAVAEQRHDEHGLLWPMAIAPFHVHLIPVSVQDEVQMAVAESLYSRLREAGAEVLLDDRAERPGVKFKDADLIGIPLRLTVGKRAAEGIVEFKRRSDEAAAALTIEEAVAQITSEIASADRTSLL
ncbi:proline--tRNA ligase [Paenibacillus hamazuiensis]|uniref:proline--tRNA ligase n=1 Tax=Paenibacillus hamazuiensis TaxID=2936508 RepID=UPI00200D2D8F|nr:proline--tRNA ligase [Paenibacillus hamazuiensis]